MPLSSETWSKLLLLNAAIVLVVSSLFTLATVQRLMAERQRCAEDAAMTPSADDIMLRASLHSLAVVGALIVGLSIVAIAASFLKHKCLLNMLFLLICGIEVYATYANRQSMQRGYAHCHDLYGPSIQRVVHIVFVRLGGLVFGVVAGMGDVALPGHPAAEAQCLNAVHSIFATVVVAVMSLLSLMLCAGCGTQQAMLEEEAATAGASNYDSDGFSVTDGSTVECAGLLKPASARMTTGAKQRFPLVGFFFYTSEDTTSVGNEEDADDTACGHKMVPVPPTVVPHNVM